MEKVEEPRAEKPVVERARMPEPESPPQAGQGACSSHKNREIHFATGNRNKFNEVAASLIGYNITAEWFECDLEEPQSESIEYISTKKARAAFEIIDVPVIADDTGLFVRSLDGFPGPYTAYAAKTIGMKGIRDLLGDDRSAVFSSVVTYVDGSTVRTFRGDIRGRIVDEPTGKGWGLDTYFVPDETEENYPGMVIPDVPSSLHRILSIKKFAEWYSRGGQR